MGTFEEKADDSASPSGSADVGNQTETSGISKRPASGPRPIAAPRLPPRPPRKAPVEDASKAADEASEEAADSNPDPLDGPAPASLDWTDGVVESKTTRDPLGDQATAGEGGEPEEESADEPDPYLGTLIGDRYVVDDVLGSGGMGRVYLAHHKVIGKKVAVKILHAELARDKEAVGRFVREARAASSIGNPHIVDVSDFGETEDGSTYFVMEYLEGDSLGDLLEKRGALDPELVCDIGIQLCDGLAAAHKHDVVHRDLKPDNVTLVRQGAQDKFCKILDFGIAKVSTGTSSTKLTMAGAVFGTPHYMSPEQAAGAAIDHRTDIYSLGVMLYEMVSGKMPFNAENFMGILTQHMYKAPVPIRALVDAPDCPPGLEALILKCLSKKPDARYQTMEELSADIRKFQADGMPKAVEEMMARSGGFNVPADYFKNAPAVVPATPTGPRPKRMGPRLVAAVGVAVAVLIVVLVMMRDSTTTAQPKVQPLATTPPPPAPVQPSAAQTATPTTTAAPSEPGKTAVLVFSKAPGAVAIRDGKSIELPETFQVEKNASLSLEIQAEGFASKTIQLDGSETKVDVELAPLHRAGPAPRRRTPKPSPKGKSGGDVVEPWD